MDTSHLPAVAAEVADVLAGVRIVHLDDVSVDSGEEITAVVEDALSALLYGKLLTGSNVVHQQVAHTELIRETHEDV